MGLVSVQANRLSFVLHAILFLIRKETMCVVKNLNILSPYSSFSPLIKYIANALSHRSEGDNKDELDGIDDTRNGLLLWSAIHHPVGTGALAFLKVSCHSPCFVLCDLSIQIDP
jgi:hypothetical protein